jgi:penicillin-binding protein 2
VLALASVPGFDPGAFTAGLTQALWRELRTSLRTPLLNKCIQGQYPPGSTFKMITALAALEVGVITPRHEVHCSGVTYVGAKAFHCWEDRHGHGRLDLVQALGRSCDVYFYDVARRTGIDAIAAMARRFGLGEKLGIDLPGEQPGLIPTTSWKKQKLGAGWHKGETLVCGIGQGFVAATPLQLAVMTARLASGRTVVPTFIRRSDRPPPEPLGLASDSLEVVLRGMREVVHGWRGTARQAAVDLPGVEMGGKTGTSQVRRMTALERALGAERRKKLQVPWLERDHALFVCFAPYREPAYAISVVVEHGQGGAKVAGPIARDIMRKALEIERHRPGSTPP